MITELKTCRSCDGTGIFNSLNPDKKAKCIRCKGTGKRRYVSFTPGVGEIRRFTGRVGLKPPFIQSTTGRFKTDKENLSNPPSPDHATVRYNYFNNIGNLPIPQFPCPSCSKIIILISNKNREVTCQSCSVILDISYLQDNITITLNKGKQNNE